MKILSWNLWNSFKRIENPFLVSFLEPYRRREFRYMQQLKLLHEAQFDVCLLQEVNPIYEKLKDFKEVLGYQSTYQLDQGGIRYKRVGIPLNFQNALATLTKKPQNKVLGLKLSGSFGVHAEDYSLQFGEFRYALFSEIMLRGAKILLVNTHFHHGIEESETLKDLLHKNLNLEQRQSIEASLAISTARKQQEMTRLLQEIEKRKAAYQFTVVAGDFNFSENATILEGLQKLELKRIEHTGFTWDPIVNHENFKFSSVLRPPVQEGVSEEALNLLRFYDSRKRTMDHIFVSEQMQVRSAKLFGQISNSEGYFPSDHFGIETVLDF